MSNIEKIRQEIERLKKILEESTYYLDNSQQALGYSFALDDFKEFIDSLPDENNPEPYNPVYDEDYLNEKIAKATKSWEGVDVNKMLAECRGYKEKPSDDLEEEIKNYFEGLWPGTETAEQCNTDLHFTPPAIMRLARHFTEWGARHSINWGDVQLLDTFILELSREEKDGADWGNSEKFYTEVLRRFHEFNDKKIPEIVAEWEAKHLK